MKILQHSSLSLLILSSVSLGDEINGIQKRELDPKKVHSISVSRDRVTTVSFPEAIGAIDGAFMSIHPNQPGLFQLAHAKGSSFFSVRCLAKQKEVKTNLNVRWDDTTYVLMLEQSETPQLSVVFQKTEEITSRQKKARPLTPASLLGLLDKAKAYPFLAAHYPKSVLDIQHVDLTKKPQITDHGEFEIRIENIYRFNHQDTLVFHLSLRNPTDKELMYRADQFSVTVGESAYPQSLSDATGIMNPKTESTAYIAITGTPVGGRNDLSPDNQFSINVPLHIEESIPQATDINPSK